MGAPAIKKKAEQGRDKLTIWGDQMEGFVLDKSLEILCTKVALVAKEHIILVGLPGIAKSMIAEALGKAITGNVFEIQFDKFTAPNAVLGPVDIPQMKQGRHVRKIDGYMPWAHVAILDEAFNANKEVLKSMQRMLNEGEYSDEGVFHKVPLILAMCTTNVLPEGADLQALDDRMIIRVQSGDLSAEKILRLRPSSDQPTVPPTQTFSIDDIDAMHGAAMKLKWSADLMAAVPKLINAMRSSDVGIYCSPRKWSKAFKALNAYAFLLGDTEVNTTHLTILENILWLKPDQRPVVQEMLNKHVAKWLAAVRKAGKTLDSLEKKQTAYIGENSSISELAAKMGTIKQQLVELNETLLVPLENVPDAQKRVRQLRDRMNNLSDRGRKAADAAGF